MTDHRLLLVFYAVILVLAIVALLDWMWTNAAPPMPVGDDLLAPLPWTAGAYDDWMADAAYEYPVPEGWTPLDVLTTRAEIEAL